ncbi:MAG: hypothetical protein ACRBFS_12155 [Aureispira sp.]
MKEKIIVLILVICIDPIFSQNTNKVSIEEASSIVYQLDRFCEDLKNELYRRSGGVDDEGQPIGKWNLIVVEKVLFEENKAVILKQKLDSTNNFLQSFMEKKSCILPLLTNKNISHPNKRQWDIYMFKSMPLAAVIPMLRKLREDAKKDLKNIITCINEQQKE